MRFEITHTTDYRYEQPASEAYVEARLTPPGRPTQKILGHEIVFDPAAPVSSYTDYFGNPTVFYSMVKRHEQLVVTNRLKVETAPPVLPDEALALTVGEARQIFSSVSTEVFDYLRVSAAVPTGGEAAKWARRFLRSDATLRAGMEDLNAAIHREFRYTKGATDNWTPLATIWKEKAGVCQDFAHVMLAVLRTAGLPARYVCGYIEAATPRGGRKLVGAVATHAWVEVMVPGMEWVALDPTNNQWCGERHVAVSFGRDFADATPLRGTFKGSGGQKMSVKVKMKRMEGDA
ncbi:MAG: transglutaminase family protein [Chthoniobacterales bacterium]|nr:transglutaminase family protein [Chthoniobacterales bacterium]